MSALAKKSGVPSATIKHYLREGLLPEPARRTGRTMAYYDESLAERIRRIKRLQREHFLPLSVIKRVLDSAAELDDDEATARAIAGVLARSSGKQTRTRAELIGSGVPAGDLDWLGRLGVLTPDGEGELARYAGDDLALLRTLSEARKAGLRPEMLPASTLATYARALGALVRAELEMFRAGVLPKAGKQLPALTEAATRLSERLVVLMRRKLLLPTLRQLAAESPAPRQRAPARPRARRAKARSRA